MHRSWRGAAEWRSENLPMYTGSDQACKLYDASVSQLVGWYNDTELGGIENTMQKLFESDPNFVMGRVLGLGLQLVGSGKTVRKDQALQNLNLELLNLAEKQTNYLSEREKWHVNAVNLLCQGEINKATLQWENILTEYPTDILALKLSNLSYLFFGYKQLLRDSVASIIPRWKTSTPLYGYLYGMYAFGLEESNIYDKAEKMALKGLSINPRDGWSTHAMGHVYEMEGRAKEGINFLNQTVSDWVSEYEAALETLESQINPRLNDEKNMIEIINYSSLIYRLNLEGLDVTKYWDKISKLCLPHVEEHGSVFVDMHLMMAYLGSGDIEASEKFMESLMEYIREEKGDNIRTSKEVGVATMNALIAAKEQRYGQVVETLYPIRHKLYQMGGSDAQRDILNLLLISSALKSQEPSHKLLGKRLLLERQAFKGQCTLQTRWQNQLLIV